MGWSDWMWDHMFEDERATLHVNAEEVDWIDHFVGMAARSQIQHQINTTIAKKEVRPIEGSSSIQLRWIVSQASQVL